MIASSPPQATPLRVRVLGAGPTGALAAFAMAEAGWEVSLHDPLTPAALQDRDRAYALTQSSRLLLDTLGLWTELEPRLSGFERLHLCDLGLDRRLDFTPADLPEAGLPPDPAPPHDPGTNPPPAAPIGWIARHRDLMALLLARLRDHPSVHLHLGSSGSSSPPSAGHGPREGPPEHGQQPDLILAADGPASPTREALGIRRWRLPYRQACLTVQVALRGSGDQEAWELLRPEGPFAVLPLGGRQAQLVWSAPAQRCQRRQMLPESAFLEQLAGVLPWPLDPDGLLDTPRSFPVALELARRLRRGRTLLVGESAHRCHPVGGQGLNLCWRDVAELHRLGLQVRQGRLPLRRLGALYARRRWPDLLLTLMATDLMVRLFSNRSPLLLPLRRLSLILLARQRPLRRLTLRVMSLGAGGALRPSPQ